MRRALLSAAWGLLLMLAMASGHRVGAVFAQQETATSTPTETATATLFYYGPSPTPTETLPPPPPNGGRVAVRVLVVRAGPSQDWNAIGGLNYGEIIYPIARSANGQWVALDWRGMTGWVLASLVRWGFDIQTLPILLPPFTSTPLSLVPGPSATAAPAVTDTPVLSSTEAPTVVPSATATPEPVTLTPLLTAEAGAVILASPTVAPTASPTSTSPGGAGLTRSILPPAAWGAGGAVLLAVVLYGWRWVAGRQRLKRYANGFILSTCPVCREGTLHLEEHVKWTLGIPQVRRSVRCDNCRSVLREVRPSVWRYTIDPFVNAELAEAHNGREFNDGGLLALAKQAEQYGPVDVLKP